MKTPQEKALEGKSKGRAIKAVKNIEHLRQKGLKTADIITKYK